MVGKLIIRHQELEPVAHEREQLRRGTQRIVGAAARQPQPALVVPHAERVIRVPLGACVAVALKTERLLRVKAADAPLFMWDQNAFGVFAGGISF